MVVKNEFRATNQHDHVLRSNAWSCFSFRTINHVTMSFVVMLGHISFSGMRPVGPGCVWAGHFTQSCPVLIMYAFTHCSFVFSLCTRPDMVSSLISKLNPMA